MSRFETHGKYCLFVVTVLLTSYGSNVFSAEQLVKAQSGGNTPEECKKEAEKVAWRLEIPKNGNYQIIKQQCDIQKDQSEYLCNCTFVIRN